jgi:hypothetical protein
MEYIKSTYRTLTQVCSTLASSPVILLVSSITSVYSTQQGRSRAGTVSVKEELEQLDAVLTCVLYSGTLVMPDTTITSHPLTNTQYLLAMQENLSEICENISAWNCYCVQKVAVHVVLYIYIDIYICMYIYIFFSITIIYLNPQIQTVKVWYAFYLVWLWCHAMQILLFLHLICTILKQSACDIFVIIKSSNNTARQHILYTRRLYSLKDMVFSF